MNRGKYLVALAKQLSSPEPPLLNLEDQGDKEDTDYVPNSSNNANILTDIPESSSSEKVYHYLESLQISCDNVNQHGVNNYNEKPKRPRNKKLEEGFYKLHLDNDNEDEPISLSGSASYVPSNESGSTSYVSNTESSTADNLLANRNDIRSCTENLEPIRKSVLPIGENLQTIFNDDILNTNEINLDETSSPNQTSPILETVNTAVPQFVYNVTKNDSYKDLCPFCFEDVGHFSRHLLRKHPDEDEVKKIVGMSLKGPDRRAAIIALRRRGNFVLNREKNQLKPVRRLAKGNESMNEALEKDYFPCVSCLGYFKKQYLWRHRKNCKANIIQSKTGQGSKIQHLSESQTFLASTGILGNFLTKSRLKNDVFAIMRPDNISLMAKTDPLICLYGESYLNKQKRKQMNVVASNKIRELARLKIVLAKSNTITSLMQALRPEMYLSIVAAAKIISGYDPSNHSFKASSLALNFGTTLKKVCDQAKKAIITKNPLFSQENRDEQLKNITELKEMVSEHWCNDVSSLAHKSLNENKWDKPKLLPITEDVLAFNNYAKKAADNAFEKLKNKEDTAENYKLLAECTLALVLVFNRKRIGELQFMTIDSYQKDPVILNQEECLSSLTELEKKMCQHFKRVVVLGKGSKPVAVLFTTKMQTYIDCLIETRINTNIVPQKNKYLFANPGSENHWMNGSSVVRKLAAKCGAKQPALLTSTRFRKQIATILQLMNFEDNEMEQVARFMGHTEKTHREFYRITEDVFQTAKVAKVLVLLNTGKGAEIKGKYFSDINITEEFIDEDDDEKVRVEEEEINQTGMTIIQQQEQITSSNTEVIQHIQKKKQPKNSSRNNKTKRLKWDKKQKTLVEKHFRGHIKNKRLPKKDDCLQFIKLHPGMFKGEEWSRIKTLVYNTYRIL